LSCSCANGHANENLSASKGTARQQKVCDVQACEEKKESSRAKEEDQANTEFTGEPALVIADEHSAVFGRKLLEENVQLYLSLCHGDSRFQARNHARVPPLIAYRVTPLQGDVGIGGLLDKSETTGHHPDDRAEAVIQFNLRSDHMGVGT